MLGGRGSESRVQRWSGLCFCRIRLSVRTTGPGVTCGSLPLALSFFLLPSVPVSMLCVRVIIFSHLRRSTRSNPRRLVLIHRYYCVFSPSLWLVLPFTFHKLNKFSIPGCFVSSRRHRRVLPSVSFICSAALRDNMQYYILSFWKYTSY